MTDRGADSRLFEELIRELLGKGLSVRFEARGASMSPAIRDREIVEVTAVIVSKLRKDDIVLARTNHGFRLHRIVLADHARNLFLTKGDCGQQNDPALTGDQILGLARAKNVRVGRTIVQARFKSVGGRVLQCAARGQSLLGKALKKVGALRTTACLAGLLLLAALPQVQAQVAVSGTTTSSTRRRTGAGAVTNNFTHTTPNTANRLLIVSTAMNITNSPGTTVTGVTYNGTALTFLGAHNDAGNTRRVEMWYLLNPATGTNVAVNVSINIPTAATVGIDSAAVTFSGVDQTVPLGSFVSADGANGASSQMDVPSVINGMILDTLATGGNQGVTASGPQVEQWDDNSGTTVPPDVESTGSTRTGAPSVPISETFTGTSNWSLGAVSINPTTADIGVTTSVSAVTLGQNSTYNITVTNSGLSAANNVVLTDTYNATNLSLVSVTPSAGTSCTNTATTITCTLPASLASGASATIAVTVSTTAAGFYPNSASVTDSGAPPDPNTGNNTYVALAPVVSVVCSAATLVTGGTISGVQNTYFPGTASVAAGAKFIPIGASTGAAGTIANGSLLLVIQMQDASINTSNSVAYGNGSTGAGFTTINNAGNYEYVKATGPVAAGSVPVTGAGAGGGLVFGYTAAASGATKGRSTYQVVLVPQYSSATLGSVSATPWNGSTGGILALDVAGQLNLGGANVSLDGVGFRGGAGMQLNGGVGGANTDYRVAAPAAYTGVVENGVDAPKGEGVAGTPLWVESASTYLNTGTNYPSGTAGTDGSMAHGAPGNAGGGGTDSNVAANDQNAGGGGGGNGGSGGFGGDSWNTNLSSGGEGGAPFPATIDRLSLGGGGGAGTRNNSDGDNLASSGSAGGGIIFIRAYNLTGTATLTANGAAAYNATANDAGGGAGAGGTIVVLTFAGGESGLTLQANGGRGGNAWLSQAYSLADRHGPGGGGGGGVVFVSGTPASISVAGGASGVTLNNPSVAYGATSGAAGSSAATASLGQVTGIQSAALCTPDMTLSKSHAGNFTRGSSAAYTIPVSNVSPYGATNGVVTINDTLPMGTTPISASGTGWTCSVFAQTVSCTRSDALAAVSAYPSITLNALVGAAAPTSVTNTATVSGGGEANLLNDTATDVAAVASTSDLSVTDAASPNPVTAGNNITYTQVVTNSGPSSADNATFVATVPANTTFVSLAVPSGWSCVTPAVGTTGTVVCTNVNMTALTAATFTLVVKVNAGTANGTVITENTSVTSSVIDPVAGNNAASATTVVGTTAPNLTVTNTASPNPVLAGNNITYTQVVTNTGTTAATGATFTENTPASTTFVSITPPAGWVCTTFPPTCTNASVAGGAVGTFTVVYKVNAATTAGTIITDTVTVNATNQSFGANSAVATDVVAGAAQADLALTTAFSPTSVFAGNNISYTQTITNKGPVAATGVSFTEVTPTNTTFQSVIAPAGWTCTTPAVGGTGTVNCTNPSLAASASADIVVVVDTVPSTAAGTITANSSVTATTGDPISSNNNTTVATPVNVICDMSVTNAGTPSPVAAGANITYTQVITNSGPSNCSTGTLSEATPANTTFVSAAVVNSGGGVWVCPNSAPVACTATTVPPGSSATLTTVYKVIAGTAAGTLINDTVSVATPSHDSSVTNNSASSSIAVAGGTQADLSVTNTASPNPVAAGSNITYTQSVTNGGPATANAPVFTEALPANTTAVSLTGPVGWTCVLGTLTCTDTTTMAPGTANFTFVVKVNNNVASGTTITQTDSVTSTTGDPTGTNNSATVNVIVAGSADLSVTNSAIPVPVQASGNITYSQVVTNAGPSTATSATFSETTPTNTTFQSITPAAGWTCSTPAVNGTGTISCTNPSVAPGSGAFTVVLKVNAGTAAGTAISDTVTVGSAVTDPNSVNNSATAADVVATAGQADLVATNIASPTSVAAGSNVTYTQSVTNLGPSAATGVTFTQVTPPNTNFQSIAPPAGWTCGTVPAVGGTGTITCTDGSNLGLNATANFTLVLQVNAGTPSGTTITETDTANATNIVPSLTSNSASATVVVANANSADVAIVKTATPNPVTQGTPLTYTLSVFNNGPASATNVMVTDTLPSVMTFLSANTTQGTCSEAGGTVTCQLGTMANAGTATVTILTIPGAPGVVSNTATVSADQTDSVPANNTSTQTETITAPTRITLHSFSAHIAPDKNGANRVVLTWKTSGEVHNLGFNVYRDVAGNRVRMNPSPIAGSALLMNSALPKHAARSYAWIDPSAGTQGSAYWLEDIDVNGARTMHGPVSVQAGMPEADMAAAEMRMLSQMNQAQPAGGTESHVIETVPSLFPPTASQLQKQFVLASHPAVKILVRHEGWYRVTQPELVAAGLDPNVDSSLLHLYAEANEQPLQVTGATAGQGGFGPQAAINFYGTGIDTIYSGTRVYWLVTGTAQGARIPHLSAASGSNLPPLSYFSTVELRQHTTYFAALLRPNGENFFGALVSSAPLDQVLTLPHLDTASTRTARLEVVLQGVIIGFPHDVRVDVNGTTIGDITFTGQEHGRLGVNLPPGLLQEGNNTVTLTAQNGDYDTSLVEFVHIMYPHSYVADSDQLKFTARAGDQVKVSGFTSAPTVLDITDPKHPVQLTPLVSSANGNYQIAVQAPWGSSSPAPAGWRTLLAVASSRIATAAGSRANSPSHWHSMQAGADIAMVTDEALAPALEPLVRAHQGTGKSSVVVPVTDLYDEFTFGERSPYAVRQFLQTAVAKWKTAPAYLLLNGRASFDPRNYLGFGHLDLVPTMIVPSSSLMTASDDWFSDFNDTGMPTIATGRLPVGTLDEATTVIAKIVAYEGTSTNGPWTSHALMVADRDDTESFTQDSQTVQKLLPAGIQVTNVSIGAVGAAARQDIVNGINSGQLLVNYLGHGSEEQWSGSNMFDTNSVGSLTNQSQLPVFLIMDCLNGFFQDIYSQPLGVTLLTAPNGGAVAVLASSGLNQPVPQTRLNALVVQNVFSAARPTLGESILKAKAQIGDASVRRTYVLFGDPAMQLKQPAPSH